MAIKLIKIRQKFNDAHISDIMAHVKQEILAHAILIRPGATIAIATGSRGICDIPKILKATIDTILELGAKPFIVPAMGSHGGATAAGQIEILKELGITEESMGVPIRSSMEVVEISSSLKNKIFMDKLSYESDGVIIVNRIKPHTDFHGQYESGIIKMMAIGLGKHKGAEELHRFGIEGLAALMPKTAEAIINTKKIIMGLAIVENQLDHPVIIRAIAAKDLMQEEPKLLQAAFSFMPSLPVKNLDLLIVKELGKNISGTGMDPNIIGRLMIRGAPEPTTPNINKIVVTDITAASHGNAIGIGLADVITRNLFNKINFQAMYANVKTSLFYDRVKIPLIEENDQQAVDVAMAACGPRSADEWRILYIKNSLQIFEMYASLAIVKELAGKIELIDGGTPCEIFENDGQLISI
ncbi:MAG: hypothetical protein A2504_14715 [Bdellovibrionales bacterium RIFOXYD12_FULL_39_22]|nr:MAG: hypothetical protein A2385_10180 [Bdellovibrionales bacterium RIFOXYB1_FULL_39_21]OFZ40831.1 MAG: hypothetical protein A2485_17340 [Bdellovibrionales bacterium RIFOXYC12_FULL_39_17]OFZ44372.1 MAG: hypothetical protein A2404_10950 [Bdellovibrionales bacterium RIFOXYC1_FULL_39_130]OFZ74119.1 MAG: hypothetical protein A2560_03615 [Bdellovibrionales bacterium RIFOXYD1_FULL_39_84]OFZ91968.1 MAG: hypothetical protein A2504_14715 [Bdellovibrionales bacterium RIFOXYD12_FULL_39_22]HLE12283.1 DU